MALLLIAAPFFEGIIRKITAWIQSRRGPPLWQPYYDLLKLLGKEDMESGESPFMQRFAVILSLSGPMVLAAFLPLLGGSSLAQQSDVILFIYLLVFCGVANLLVGLSAGSTYSLLGTSREMMSAITLEPLLVVALVIGAIHADSLQLAKILSGSVYEVAGIPWSGLVMAAIIGFSFQAFIGRIPFDIAEAETEIMEGPIIEYSGPKLALLKWSHMAKLVIYASIITCLFLPWGNEWMFPLGMLVFWIKVIAIVLAVTVIAATHARWRIDQSIRYFMSFWGVAFWALLLAIWGY
jgi:formate hydrogenlyase subunit 4